MKTILLWDARFPDRRPARLSVEDAVASAAVRAGVAAAANPAEAGALSAGAALDPTMLTEVVLQHGNGGATRRVFLPYSVVMVGASAGVLAAIGTPIPGGVTPTPSPTPTLVATPSTKSIAANAAAGTLISAITGVPSGVTPSVSPNDGRFAIAGDAANGWKVVTGLSALSAGTVSVSVNASGATGALIALTITAAAIAERFMTAGTRDPGGTQSSGTNTVVRTRRRVRCFATGPQMRYQEALFFVDANGVEQPIVQPAGTQMAFSLECPGAPTTLNRFKFAGATSTTDPTGPVVESDLLNASDFGLTNFTPGVDYFVIKQYYNPAGNMLIPVYEGSNPEASNTAGEAFYMTTGTLGLGDVDTPGGLPSRGASATTRQSHPLGLVGPHSGRAWLQVGDSIPGGRGSTRVAGDGGPSGTGLFPQGGYAAQGFYAAQVPHHLSTKPGCQGSQYTAANAAIRISRVKYATDLEDEYGINDLSAGLTAAAILADDARRSDLWLAVNPTLNLYRTTITPKTTGTWATLDGQTVSAGFAATNSVKSAVNAGRFAAVGTKNLRAIFDLNASVSDPTASDKYRPHGATGTTTAASTASSTISLSTPATGGWAVGQLLLGSGISVGNIKIQEQLSGTAGQAGDYRINLAASVASGVAITADSATIDGLHFDQARHDKAGADHRDFVTSRP